MMGQFLFICFLLFFLNFMGCVLARKFRNKKYLKIAFWLQVVLLMSLSMFRDVSVGKDTYNYVDLYQRSSFELLRYEPGFILLMRICKKISTNPHFFLCLTSIFIFYAFGKTIWRYSRMPSLSLYIIYCYVFFNFALSGLRESLAIAIILLSFPYLLNRKYIKFVLGVIIATSMHVTACVFVFTIFLVRLDVSKKNMMLLLITSIVLQSLFNFMLNYALLIVPAYKSYMGGEYFGDTRLASILDLGVLFLIVLFSLYYHNKEYIVEFDDIFVLLVCFATAIMIISLKFNLLSRLALYYSFFIAILLPNVLSKSKGLVKSFLTSIIVAVFTLYNVTILLFRPEWNATFPYKFYFL